MTNTYTENDVQEMMVFRVPKNLADNTQELATKRMISKSAICRIALLEYLASDTSGNLTEILPQY